MHNKDQSIYLIDGHALCYRAYYAIKDLSTSREEPTNAIYGFINILRKLIREYEPERMVVVFDMKAPTVRHAKYKDYKIHRKPMPDDLACQIPKIKEVINAYRIPTCQLEGYEADDIIATLAERAKKRGLSVTVVTSDKDALQLVDKKLRVVNSNPTGDKIYEAGEVKDKYGVEPEAMVELMALTGDASDNIPGVKGIGQVTAGKLVKLYGSVSGIYKNIDSISSGSVRKKLQEGRDMAELSRELVQLDRNVPVELDFDRTRLTEPDRERLTELYREFEFEKLLREVMPREENKGRYDVKRGEKNLRKMIDEISKRKAVALRVSGGKPEEGLTGIAFSWSEKEACFVPLKPGRGSFARGVPALLKDMLEDENIKKIGHDIKEDILALRHCGVNVRGTGFDVMIADYLIDPSRPKYDLPGIALRHLGRNLSEEKGEAEFMHVCEQCDMIIRLYAVLDPILKEKHLISLFQDVEMPLVDVLADMEDEGVSIDIKYLEECSVAMEKKLAEISEKIFEFAGEEFNINSPKQLQVILYDKLGLPVTKKTKTGRSTDESVLRKLAAFHELPQVLLKYREMNKLKTAYYDSILGLADKSTGKLHAHFNQAVTATGRLSSSEPNLQNIPVKTTLGKEIRKAFVAGGKGNLLLAADYSQIELRILAHLSKDKKLIEAFKKGEDVHRRTASEIFDCSLSEVTDKMRSSAKTVNFGIVYGMSPFGLAEDLGISVEESRRFIEAYFDRYSGVKTFIDRTIAGAKKTGFVTTLLNRRRYIPEIKSPNERLRGFGERVATNTPVQGSAADLIKLAMIACSDAFKDAGVRMIIQVHDELVFKVPEELLEDTAKRVKEIMEGVIELEVPLEVDVEAGKNWLEMKEVVL